MKSVSYDPTSIIAQEERSFSVFFSTLKGFCGEGIVKVFMVGTTPLILSQMTSGFNIALHLHNDEYFFDMNGFFDFHVNQGLDFIRPALTKEDKAKAFELIKRLHNGYRFIPKQEDGLFNSNRILYTLNAIQRLKYSNPFCTIDKILESLPQDENSSPTEATLFLIQRVVENKESILLEIFSGPIKTKIRSNFHLSLLNELNKDNTAIFSLIYYVGGLTYGHKSISSALVIPNEIAEREYIDRLYLMTKIDESLPSVCRNWIQTRDISNFCKLVSKYMKDFQFRDVTENETQSSAGN